MKKVLMILRSLVTLIFNSQNAELQDYLHFQSVIDLFARKDLAVSYYRQFEHAAQAIQNKIRFQVKVPELRQLPPETLGFNLYRHIQKLGEGYGEFPNLNTQTDYDYINTHMFESHDVWHTVLGLSTTVRDEIHLQAFMAAQTPGYLSNLMCVLHLAGILFFRPSKFLPRCRSVYRYYTCGKQAQPLFGIDWNQLLNEDLNVLRQELRISLDGSSRTK